jgi:transcriptional regulator with XRE-family HTH domain
MQQHSYRKTTMATLLTPQLCRAARSLLGWGQRELAARSKVSHKTIADYELGDRQPYDRTLIDLRRTFEEQGGLRFIDEQEGVTGPGVAFTWNTALSQRASLASPSVDGNEGGETKALDHEMAEYFREHLSEWDAFREASKQALSMAMYGDPYAADEAFGNDAR